MASRCELGDRMAIATVNGENVSASEVLIDLANLGASDDCFEICVSIPKLLHELAQAGIDENAESIADFVAQDISKFRDDALRGYLNFTRYPLHAVPKETSSITARWVYNKVNSIVVIEQSVVIRGNARKY